MTQQTKRPKKPIMGWGIVQGLWVTFRHLVSAYVDDIRWLGKRYYNPEGVAYRSSASQKGVFTVQYPEEKLPVPENFRFLPFLVYDEGPNGEKNIRCTACGICSKVCPPQCIWIVRKTDPETGKPISQPAEYAIDADICMNCGFCAEFCPFDAIKMDHDYEIASYNRMRDNMYHLDKLMKSASYYASIRPTYAAEEDAIRAEKEAKKTAATAAR
jgi:NADH-quinone oxidoreductase subunit I